MNSATQPTTTNPKDAIGRTKPPLHLVPPTAAILESLVFALGAKKYGAYNWRSTAVAGSVYVAAALRHLFAWFDGQDNDPESGISHLAHARAGLAIMLDAESVGMLADDRPRPGAAAELIRRHTGEPPAPALPAPAPAAVLPSSNFYDAAVDMRGAAVAAEKTGDFEYDEARKLFAGWHEPAPLPAASSNLPLGRDGSAGVIVGRVDYDPRKLDVLTLLYGVRAPAQIADQVAGGITYAPRRARIVRRAAYVAGPMRGHVAFNFPAFDAARDRLVTAGYDVISPADIDRHAGDENSDNQPLFALRDFFCLYFLRVALEGGAGFVAMLPGWEKSAGAAAEFFLARWLGLTVIDARTLQPLNFQDVDTFDLLQSVKLFLNGQLAK